MKKTNRYKSTLIGLGFAAFTLHTASAVAGERPFYFELDFEQQRIPQESNSRLEANAFGFLYREFLSDHMALSLRLGRLTVEHEQNALAFGFDPSGYYVGLGFNSHTAEKNRLQAGFDLSYSYYDSREERDTETLDVSWTQGEAKLWASVRISTQFKLYGCVFALSLDGDQKLKGTTTSKQSLENMDDSGECAGLILETEDYGVVGIEGSGGARQGGLIYFGKRFY